MSNTRVGCTSIPYLGLKGMTSHAVALFTSTCFFENNISVILLHSKSSSSFGNSTSAKLYKRLKVTFQHCSGHRSKVAKKYAYKRLCHFQAFVELFHFWPIWWPSKALQGSKLHRNSAFPSEKFVWNLLFRTPKHFSEWISATKNFAIVLRIKTRSFLRA